MRRSLVLFCGIAIALGCAALRAEVVENDDTPRKEQAPKEQPPKSEPDPLVKPARSGDSKPVERLPLEVDEPGFKARASFPEQPVPKYDTETPAAAPKPRKIVKSSWALPQEDGIDPTTVSSDADSSADATPETKDTLSPMLAKAMSRDKSNAKVKDVIAAYQEVVNAEPENAMAHYKLGLALRRNGDVVTAFGEIAKALKLHPKDPLYQCDFGLVALQVGEFEKALAACQSAAVLAPSNARFQSALGDCLLASHQINSAAEAYRRAVNLEPNNAEYIHNLGVAHYHGKAYKIAIDIFSEAIRLKPDCSTYYCSRGIARENNKGIREAIQDYLTALRYDKNDAHAHFLLASVYSDPDDPTFTSAFEAVEHATRAVQLTQGRNAKYLMGLARAFSAAHRYDAAVDAARKAISVEDREDYRRELAQLEKLLKQGFK